MLVMCERQFFGFGAPGLEPSVLRNLELLTGLGRASSRAGIYLLAGRLSSVVWCCQQSHHTILRVSNCNVGDI